MKRWLKRIGAGLLALALVAGLLWLGAQLYPSGIPRGDGGQPATADTFACPEPCDLFAIAWAGDTMVGGSARRRIKKHGYGLVIDGIKPQLQADFTIGNAEAPFTDLRKKWDPDQFWSYRVRPKVARVLAQAGFDAFSLANNHAWDRGPEGAADSRTHLDAVGIELFGVGVDRAEAERPLIVETPHGAVGVVGIESTHRGGQEAGPDRPGTARLRRGTLQRSVAAAREAGARWVVAFPHWGANYAPVNFEQKWWAHRMVDAGFDLVIGHGPHIQQPVGRIDGVPVVYSLGNWSFNTPGRFQKLDQLPFGLVAHTYLGPEGFEGIELHCHFADNRVTAFRPRPCTAEERELAFRELGPEVQVRGELGVVTF